MAVRARLLCGTTEGLLALHCPLHGDASAWKRKHELCLRRSARSKQPRWKPGHASNDWHYFKACRSMAAPACLGSALSCLSYQPGAPWGLSALPSKTGFCPISSFPLYLPKVSIVPGWETWGSKSAQCISCLLKHWHFHFWRKKLSFKNPKLFLTVLLYIYLAYTFAYFQTKGKRRWDFLILMLFYISDR